MECKICVSEKEFLIENTHKKKSRNSLIFSTSLTKVSSNQQQIDPQIQLERTHAHRCCTASPCLVLHLYSLQLCLLDSAYPFFFLLFPFFALCISKPLWESVSLCVTECAWSCQELKAAFFFLLWNKLQGALFLNHIKFPQSTQAHTRARLYAHTHTHTQKMYKYKR